MNVQLVSDTKGKITAVQVPLKEWKNIEKKLEAFDVAESIKIGYSEMKLIEKGTLKAKTFEDFLNEL